MDWEQWHICRVPGIFSREPLCDHCHMVTLAPFYPSLRMSGSVPFGTALPFACPMLPLPHPPLYPAEARSFRAPWWNDNHSSSSTFPPSRRTVLHSADLLFFLLHSLQPPHFGEDSWFILPQACAGNCPPHSTRCFVTDSFRRNIVCVHQTCYQWPTVRKIPSTLISPDTILLPLLLFLSFPTFKSDHWLSLTSST